jgi:hypothetical protein
MPDHWAPLVTLDPTMNRNPASSCSRRFPPASTPASATTTVSDDRHDRQCVPGLVAIEIADLKGESALIDQQPDHDLRASCGALAGADGLDPELAPVDVDQGDHLLCWRSSFAPKKLAARSRISLARVTSRSSCSSSWASADSVAVTPGEWSSSISA